MPLGDRKLTSGNTGIRLKLVLPIVYFSGVSLLTGKKMESNDRPIRISIMVNGPTILSANDTRSRIVELVPTYWRYGPVVGAKHRFPKSSNLTSVSGTRKKISLFSSGSPKLVEMVSLMDLTTVLSQNVNSSRLLKHHVTGAR